LQNGQAPQAPSYDVLKDAVALYQIEMLKDHPDLLAIGAERFASDMRNILTLEVN
jgi:hypothetical protein